MSAVKLRASRALWRARELYRFKRWRHYVKTRPAGDPHRAKWFGLYQHARTMRLRRDKQIAGLQVVHVDRAGRAFITREEGVVLHPYNDSRGFATIGVGHLLHYSNVTDGDRRRWAGFTLNDAEALLSHDLYAYEQAVARVFRGSPLKPTQSEFNACTSLAFNIGIGGFTSSTVARAIRGGNRQAAAHAFLNWAHPPELLGRREREQHLFLSS